MNQSLLLGYRLSITEASSQLSGGHHEGDYRFYYRQGPRPFTPFF